MQPESFMTFVTDIERERKLRPLRRRLQIIPVAALASPIVWGLRGRLPRPCNLAFAVPTFRFECAMFVTHKISRADAASRTAR